MKKPAWEGMQVIDVREIDKATVAALAAAYDQLSKATLLPLAQLDVDETRRKIDKAICEALKLPSLKTLRELLVREPGLTGTDEAGAAEPDSEVDDD